MLEVEVAEVVEILMEAGGSPCGTGGFGGGNPSAPGTRPGAAGQHLLFKALEMEPLTEEVEEVELIIMALLQTWKWWLWYSNNKVQISIGKL